MTEHCNKFFDGMENKYPIEAVSILSDNCNDLKFAVKDNKSKGIKFEQIKINCD